METAFAISEIFVFGLWPLLYILAWWADVCAWKRVYADRRERIIARMYRGRG